MGRGFTRDKNSVHSTAARNAFVRARLEPLRFHPLILEETEGRGFHSPVTLYALTRLKPLKPFCCELCFANFEPNLHQDSPFSESGVNY